jgi:L-arabinose isomerase
MFILRNFMGRGPLYTELFTVDLEENAFLMGHAGYHDPYHHDPDHGVRIVPDVEYENSDPLSGACIYFKLKPGPVTAVNAVYTGEKLRWSVFEGESVPGPPKMNGNCHLLMKVPMPIPAFYRHMVEAGVSQHIIVIPGHGVERLERLCSWLNIDFMVVR